MKREVLVGLLFVVACGPTPAQRQLCAESVSANAAFKEKAKACASANVRTLELAKCERNISACTDQELGMLSAVNNCLGKAAVCVAGSDEQAWYNANYLPCATFLSDGDGGAVVSEACVTAIRPD